MANPVHENKTKLGNEKTNIKQHKKLKKNAIIGSASSSQAVETKPPSTKRARSDDEGEDTSDYEGLQGGLNSQGIAQIRQLPHVGGVSGSVPCEQSSHGFVQQPTVQHSQYLMLAAPQQSAANGMSQGFGPAYTTTEPLQSMENQRAIADWMSGGTGETVDWSEKGYRDS